MIQIKRFIDRVATMEGKQGRDVILPLADARALRDEIAKLVLDRYTDAPAQSDICDCIAESVMQAISESWEFDERQE